MSYIFNEKEFQEFRKRHPSLQYWQALKSYIAVDRIEVVFHEEGEIIREDTFHWHDSK